MKVKGLIIGGILATAAWVVPGSANAAFIDCSTNNMCMWGNNDWEWLIGERAHGSATNVNMYGEQNNQMDSWANNSATYTGCMFGATNGTGDKQTMAKKSNDNNVSPLNSDEVSSWRTKNGC